MADHIQIGDIAPRIQYAANGTQTQFTYPFPIFVAADLEVYLGAVKQTSGFTVAGAGLSAGGSVMFAAAPTSGVVVTLRRKIAIKRTSDFQESGEFRAKVINDELDYQTAALQQVADDAARAVRLSPTDAAADLTLPDKAARASKFLACDADGKIIPAAGAAGGVPVSAFMATVLDDADAPAARATLNALAPNGDGSLLTNLPLDAALAIDIRLLALETAALKGDRLNMANGWADPLKDETDIETGSNINATFVSTGGGYYNFLGAEAAISGATGTAIGNMTGNGGLAAAFDGTTAQAAAACALDGGATPWVGKQWASIKRISKVVFTGSSDNGIKLGSPTTFEGHLEGSSSGAWGGEQVVLGSNTSFTDSAGVSGTVTATVGGTYLYHRLRFRATDGTGDNWYLAEAVFYETPALDGTVVSKQVVAASAVPTIGRFHAQIKDVTGGSTPNTDFKGYVSRNNGTTYTQGTLVLAQTLADGTKAYEFDNLSISGQPSGTAPRFKFTTHNSKEIQLHGAVVQWK